MTERLRSMLRIILRMIKQTQSTNNMIESYQVLSIEQHVDVNKRHHTKKKKKKSLIIT
jgi:hypothetical protein